MVNGTMSKMLEGIANMMLTSEADEWAVRLGYDTGDVFNVVYIFHHVLNNVGIKGGYINEAKAVEFGERLRQLVKDMTGYDTITLTKNIANAYKDNTPAS